MTCQHLTAAVNEMFNWVRPNAEREKIVAILSHKLDRGCRNMRDASRLQELEDHCGVQLSFVENPFGPGATGALRFKQRRSEGNPRRGLFEPPAEPRKSHNHKE
jgi:hypothetical protein